VRFSEKNAHFRVDNFPSLLLKEVRNHAKAQQKGKERPLKNAQKEPGTAALDGLDD